MDRCGQLSYFSAILKRECANVTACLGKYPLAGFDNQKDAEIGREALVEGACLWLIASTS